MPLLFDRLDEARALCETHPERFMSIGAELDRRSRLGTLDGTWYFADTAGAPQGLAFRVGATLVAATLDDVQADLALLIRERIGLIGVRANVALAALLVRQLPAAAITTTVSSWFMVHPGPARDLGMTGRPAKRATAADLDRLEEFYARAGTMRRTRENVAERLAEGRVFLVESPEQPGCVAAAALLNCEGDASAVIGGVYTRPELRGRGYASACTAALAASLLSDGKLPTLFYENPVAGRVYERLGFKVADEWTIAYLRMPG